MKKIYIISIIVILAALVVALPALANPGRGAIKGEVIAIDPGEGTVTLEGKKVDLLVVNLPEDFDPGEIEAGDWLLVKGTAGEEGVLDAEWVKLIGKGKDNGNDEKAEGKKDNSAFCDPEKQDKFHPLAEKIGERFGVGEDWVMDYFCEGYGMGAIMLALKTSQMEGSDAGELLDLRSEGQGWGQIWKEKGLIGSEKEGFSPPGHLKRPDHAGPKDKDE
jgi:hypothetical protein